MYKQQYEDYKYVMQDVYQLYVGAKYTFDEVVENEEIPFKFRLIMERYIYQDLDPETTLESYFYYLDGKGLPYKIFRQIKLKVKISILAEKKSLTGKSTKRYTTQVAPIEQFVKLTPAQKEEKGVVIQEVLCSKLALMAF